MDAPENVRAAKIATREFECPFPGGNDIIADPSNFLSTLQFADIDSTDVTLSRTTSNSGDLVITVNATGKTITVQRGWANGGPLLAVTLADGVSWSRTQIEDILSGQSGDGGSSNYRFSRGDGPVTLDAGVSVVQMGAGIAQRDVLLQASGNDLIVKLAGTSDSITVQGDLTTHLWGVASALRQLKFSDGSALDIGEPAAGQGQPVSFTWLGNSSYNTLSTLSAGNGQSLAPTRPTAPWS
jgi:Haemolysin-type calcium binding protein related domain